MPKFNYKAIDRSGKITTGQISAPSKSAVKTRILKMNFKPLSVKIDSESISDDDDTGEVKILGDLLYKDKNGQIQIALGNDNPTDKHIIIFTKQLATMLNSGVPLIQSLTILGDQQPSRTFARILRKIRISVENGATLSDSMEAFPEIYDTLFVAMVRAGEASGNLDVILVKLVTYIEKAAKIKNQVKSAMMYPLIVLTVAIVVVSGLLVFVVPTFAKQFEDNGQKLPGLTQFVIDQSNAFAENWYIIIGGAIVLGVAFKFYINTVPGRKVFDRYILRAPGIGPLLQKIAVGRFCSTMASMLNSGVNLLEALSICAASSGNVIIEEFVTGVREALEQGAKLSEPLAEGNLFPDMVVSMVSVGEATGALDEMLEKVSAFYEEEVDLAVQTMLSMIEPLMIVGIGGIVGFIVIAMYLPVFEMAGGIG